MTQAQLEGGPRLGIVLIRISTVSYSMAGPAALPPHVDLYIIATVDTLDASEGKVSVLPPSLQINKGKDC
jgi:hypothetical protein